MDLKIGLKHKMYEIVTLEKCAKQIGSGTLNVYATPSMIALMENTSKECVAPYLDSGQTTVGTKVNISHISPSLPGVNIYCESILTEVDRKRLVFTLSVFDEKSKIGEGTHERFIVDKTKFIEKLINNKGESL